MSNAKTIEELLIEIEINCKINTIAIESTGRHLRDSTDRLTKILLEEDTTADDILSQIECIKSRADELKVLEAEKSLFDSIFEV